MQAERLKEPKYETIPTGDVLSQPLPDVINKVIMNTHRYLSSSTLPAGFMSSPVLFYKPYTQTKHKYNDELVVQSINSVNKKLADIKKRYSYNYRFMSAADKELAFYANTVRPIIDYLVERGALGLTSKGNISNQVTGGVTTGYFWYFCLPKSARSQIPYKFDKQLTSSDASEMTDDVNKISQDSGIQADITINNLKDLTEKLGPEKLKKLKINFPDVYQRFLEKQILSDPTTVLDELEKNKQEYEYETEKKNESKQYIVRGHLTPNLDDIKRKKVLTSIGYNDDATATQGIPLPPKYIYTKLQTPTQLKPIRVKLNMGYSYS